MKVLIVGGGGREHALAHKISQSKKVDKIYCAPGNGGISQIAECVDIKATDIKGMADFAQNAGIDLTVVAQDDPLALGMVDEFEKRGLAAFDEKGCRNNQSKVFQKSYEKVQHPDCGLYGFDNKEDAASYLADKEYPIVIKAEGLALGKGVIIAQSYDEAKNAVDRIMDERIFGNAATGL